MFKFFARGKAATDLAFLYQSINSKIDTIELAPANNAESFSEIILDFKKEFEILDKWNFPPSWKLYSPAFGWKTIGLIHTELLIKLSDVSEKMGVKEEVFALLEKVYP